MTLHPNSELIHRLQALAAWEKSLHAWQKALDCLPKEALSPEQQKMKIQFEEGLEKAEVARKKIETGVIAVPKARMQSGKMPWQRAAALRSKKLAAQVPSCVRIFHQEKTRPRS